MFVEALQRPGDVWKICNLANGESLPDDIRECQGIAITGSRFNCRDRDTLTWFKPLCELLQHAAQTGHPKVYGGCFGCQVAAFALGGEVDYNPDRRFLLRAEDVKFSCCDGDQCGLPPMPAEMEGRCCSSGLKLLVSHGDAVCKLPPNATLLASSASCTVEVFLAGSAANILACQSHPEFDFQYAIEDRIWKSVVDLNKRLTPEEAEASRRSFESYDGTDAKLMLRWIADFLHT